MTTVSAAIRPESSPTEKHPKGFKKVLKYFQDQATQNSSSKAVIYLTPAGQEPQQRISHRHRPQPQQQEKVSRTLSNATTAVEPHRQRQRQHRQSQPRRPTPSARTSNSRAEMRSSQVLAQKIRKLQYASENLLQSYELYQPENPSQQTQENGYWILYIHGGYFRDPKVDASSFRPALDLLTSSSSSTIAEESESSSSHSATSPGTLDLPLIQQHAAGYASINYRLSASDSYPQDPDATLKYEERNARYPDQLHDVIAAIRHLESRHQIGARYILAGHSVGATLAFLVALHAADHGITPPACVVGLNGIYDFPEIHHTNPDYEGLTKSAMTSEQYSEASPALCQPADFCRNGETTRFLLTHSHDDELVNWEQVDRMASTLARAKEVARETGVGFRNEVVETKGRHDEIWERGRELARSICEGLRIATAS